MVQELLCSEFTIVDCPLSRFNYRSTHYMAMNGYYPFLNWFDDRSWYPLGRIVGGTVGLTALLG